jgi:hypothetical protein
MYENQEKSKIKSILLLTNKYKYKHLSLYGMGTTERDYTKQQQYMLFIQLKYTSMKNDLSEMHEPKNIK